eukprot:jgi/Botrbrau1/21506/Bobra.174_2s0013.1
MARLAPLVLILLVTGGESTSVGHERKLQQAGSFSQPLTGGSVLGQVGLTKAASGGSSGDDEAPAVKPSPKASAPSGPASRGTSGLIAGTSSGAGLERQAAKVPQEESAIAQQSGMDSPATSSSQPHSSTSKQTASQTVDENGQPANTASSLDPAATQALKNAGLLPFHKIKGNVHVGSGGQAEYGLHKDDKEIKQISIKEKTPSGPLGGGGYADYIAKSEQIDVEKGVGPVDDVIIPAGYADYGTPKLEVDVSWNKAGQSVVCHFPSPYFQGTGANPYTVRPLTLPPLVAKLFLERQKGKTFDFAAPPPGQTVFGPGCVRYDNNCDFGGQVACSGRGICDSSFPNQCICLQGRATCLKNSSGCETNTNTDFQRCGSCTNNCSASPEGFEACCNGQCTDFDSPSNCGACGSLCYDIGGNATCANKVCDIKCFNDTPTKCTGPFNGSGLVLPNVTFCVNVNTSIFACGGCGNVCPSDPNGVTTCALDTQVPPQPACLVTCNVGFRQCATDLSTSSDCANIRSDPTNCGQCGRVCPAPSGGTAICTNGVCGVQCNQGLALCGGVGTVPLTCQNLNNDVRNCGVCSRPCLPLQDSICVNGQCLFVFFGGFGFSEKRHRNGSSRALPPEYYGQGNTSRFFLPLHKEGSPYTQRHSEFLETHHAAHAEEAPAASPTEEILDFAENDTGNPRPNFP